MKYVKEAIAKGTPSGKVIDENGQVMTKFIYPLEGKLLEVRINPDMQWLLTAF